MQIADPHILSTELVILESICEVKEYREFTVYKSDLFPTFYGGNQIFVKEISSKSLSDWETIFDTHFEQNIFKHKTFNFVSTVGHPDMIREAKIRGYDYGYCSYMSTDALQLFKVPKDIEIVRILGSEGTADFKRSQKEWTQYKKFLQKCNDQEWFWKEGFRKQKYITSSLNIEWFVLRKKKSKKILASLGVFKHKNMARLQDVMTHPKHRQKGYASLMVRYIINYALNTLKSEKIIVQCDSLNHAHHLYEKCGFKTEFELLEMMKYPVQPSLNGHGS